MDNPQPLKSTLLNDNGLNLQAVFNLSDLPEGITALLKQVAPDISRFKQLIVFAHAGRLMWESMQRSEYRDAAEPVDSFSLALVRRYFTEACSRNNFEILYPGGNSHLPLQQLGQLAGWHHDSPFRVGVNAVRGSWFAYRVVALADTTFEPALPPTAASPCERCTEKPCLSACPVAATDRGNVSLKLCMDYRLKDGSLCKDQCPARLACPVAPEYRYCMAQVNYHYGRSLQSIEQYSR